MHPDNPGKLMIDFLGSVASLWFQLIWGLIKLVGKSISNRWNNRMKSIADGRKVPKRVYDKMEAGISKTKQDLMKSRLGMTDKEIKRFAGKGLGISNEAYNKMSRGQRIAYLKNWVKLTDKEREAKSQKFKANNAAAIERAWAEYEKITGNKATRANFESQSKEAKWEEKLSKKYYLDSANNDKRVVPGIVAAETEYKGMGVSRQQWHDMSVSQREKYKETWASLSDKEKQERRNKFKESSKMMQEQAWRRYENETGDLKTRKDFDKATKEMEDKKQAPRDTYSSNMYDFLGVKRPEPKPDMDLQQTPNQRMKEELDLQKHDGKKIGEQEKQEQKELRDHAPETDNKHEKNPEQKEDENKKEEIKKEEEKKEENVKKEEEIKKEEEVKKEENQKNENEKDLNNSEKKEEKQNDREPENQKNEFEKEADRKKEEEIKKEDVKKNENILDPEKKEEIKKEEPVKNDAPKKDGENLNPESKGPEQPQNQKKEENISPEKRQKEETNLQKNDGNKTGEQEKEQKNPEKDASKKEEPKKEAPQKDKSPEYKPDPEYDNLVRMAQKKGDPIPRREAYEQAKKELNREEQKKKDMQKKKEVSRQKQAENSKDKVMNNNKGMQPNSRK